MNTLARFAMPFLLLLLGEQAIAGGEAWPVRVLSLEQGWFSRFTLVVEVVPQATAPDGTLFGCTRLTIDGRFARPSLLRSHPEGVTRSSHQDALALLKRASAGSAVVRFGVLGTGLVQDEDAPPCTFLSRGLHLLQTSEGSAVLSLHNAV